MEVVVDTSVLIAAIANEPEKEALIELTRGAGLIAPQSVHWGEVKIRRKDGQVFVIRPESKTGSALDVEGIDLGVTSAEIVEIIRESRSQER